MPIPNTTDMIAANIVRLRSEFIADFQESAGVRRFRQLATRKKGSSRGRHYRALARARACNQALAKHVLDLDQAA